MNVAYLDSSALAKLAIAEPESEALRAAIVVHDVLCVSIVGRVEFERAIRRRVDGADDIISAVLSGIDVLPLHIANSAIAAIVEPRALRSLDAIHLATLLDVRDDIVTFYCYDQQLAAAASDHGIEVAAPA